ncbi:disulfide bond formation protein DsbA [Streptomyces sp. H23]|uniref:mycothiol-dependent nitroreductase Rv2466c family protein n=1 Tax=Streptomyces sp. H23 TaxID=2541723 RepID=UPI0023EA4E9C|nr:disulfide bond formation protein DsbA [Streptomyces sp. H23]
MSVTETPTEPPSRPVAVDFWFDPVCPWAWMTSRWLLEVAERRPLDIRWRLMSLAVLNEGREDLPERYRRLLTEGWAPVRLVAAAQRKYGDEVTGRLYTALGTRIHVQGLGPTREALAGALQDAGLPPELLDETGVDTWDADVRASHQEGIDHVGEEVGTPVIALPGPDGTRRAFFGPVVSPAPRGEAATRLWDGLLLLAATPGFHELQRTRTQGPVFD